MDETLRLANGSFVDSMRMWVERMGKRTQVWDDLVCVDLELPVALPVNSAIPLSAPTENALERIAAFFAERDAGPYEIWSLWPIPRLGDPGDGVPCMVRDAGGAAPTPPAELDLVEATNETTVRDAEAIINEVFDIGGATGSMLGPACLGDDFRTWVGYVDGKAVTTATACIDEGFVGIQAVGTTAGARGHGYGEAVTWAATLCRPELPAALQSSSMGRPVYERMGYRTIAEYGIRGRER